MLAPSRPGLAIDFRAPLFDGPVDPGAKGLPMKRSVTRQLATAIAAARTGWALPIRKGQGVTGALFMRLMQAQIAGKLDPERLARYVAMRDAVQRAVRLLRTGDRTASGRAFEACAARLPQFANDPELDGLARSWLDQARALFCLRQGDYSAAEAHLRSAIESDIRLERDHGYDLIHVRRIHKVHLWVQVQAAQGIEAAALDGAEAILAYVNGFGDDLPLGTGWSSEAASKIPGELAAAMTHRVASDVGCLLCGLDRERSAGALDRLPALDRLTTGVHGEVADWVAIKRAWSEGRTDDFLARAISYLALGRRQTCLWYAVLLDLCRAARPLRPTAARFFCEEVAGRAGRDRSIPRPLRREMENSIDEPPAISWMPTIPTRRFHLVCVGLPRSGACSLFALFRNFRVASEYAQAETVRALVDRHKGRLSHDALRAYMARRDREGALEMDAASFLHPVVDVLVGLSDETRFVLPFCEPGAWFESCAMELQRVYHRHRSRGRRPPVWQRDYGETLFGRFDWQDFATPDTGRTNLRDPARRFLTYWARATGRMLDTLPPERTLVLRAQDIDAKRYRLAAFVDQPGNSLIAADRIDTGFAGPRSPDGIPQDWLARAATEICGATYARALKLCAA